MTICPKECPDRHPGCHDHCERYAENEVLLELDDLLETLTCWLSFAAVALSVIVVAAYVWYKAAEQKATRAEPRKRKDGMT